MIYSKCFDCTTKHMYDIILMNPHTLSFVLVAAFVFVAFIFLSLRFAASKRCIYDNCCCLVRYHLKYVVRFHFFVFFSIFECYAWRLFTIYTSKLQFGQMVRYWMKYENLRRAVRHQTNSKSNNDHIIAIYHSNIHYSLVYKCLYIVLHTWRAFSLVYLFL